MADERASVPFGDNVSLDEAVPRKSKYLTKEECDPPILVQIAWLAQDEVKDNDGKIEMLGVLYFNGEIKPLILNATNRDTLKAILHANTAADLKGKQIILFNDLTVSFQGRVGGVRIRSSQQEAPVSHVPQAQPPYPPPVADQEFNDHIPFP